jgi:hypothetical protein
MVRVVRVVIFPFPWIRHPERALRVPRSTVARPSAPYTPFWYGAPWAVPSTGSCSLGHLARWDLTSLICCESSPLGRIRTFLHQRPCQRPCQCQRQRQRQRQRGALDWTRGHGVGPWADSDADESGDNELSRRRRSGVAAESGTPCVQVLCCTYRTHHTPYSPRSSLLGGEPGPPSPIHSIPFSRGSLFHFRP